MRKSLTLFAAIIVFLLISLSAEEKKQEKPTKNEQAIAAVKWLEKQPGLIKKIKEKISSEYEEMVIDVKTAKSEDSVPYFPKWKYDCHPLKIATSRHNPAILVDFSIEAVEIDLYVLLVDLWRNLAEDELSYECGRHTEQDKFSFGSAYEKRQFRIALSSHIVGLNYLSQKLSYFVTQDYINNRDKNELSDFQLAKICHQPNRKRDFDPGTASFYYNQTVFERFIKLLEDEQDLERQIDITIDGVFDSLAEAYNGRFAIIDSMSHPELLIEWPRYYKRRYAISKITINSDAIVDVVMNAYLEQEVDMRGDAIRLKTVDVPERVKFLKQLLAMLDEHPEILQFIEVVIKKEIKRGLLDSNGFVKQSKGYNAFLYDESGILTLLESVLTPKKND